MFYQGKRTNIMPMHHDLSVQKREFVWLWLGDQGVKMVVGSGNID